MIKFFTTLNIWKIFKKPVILINNIYSKQYCSMKVDMKFD